MQLKINADDDFAVMIDTITRWTLDKKLGQLGQPADRYFFEYSASDVGAYYRHYKHTVTIPAAIIQPPFFSRSFPKVVNYARFGSSIGHEFTHAFYNENNQCLVDQYSQFGAKDDHGVEHKLSGEKTATENVADIGGFKAAYLVG